MPSRLPSFIDAEIRASIATYQDRFKDVISDIAQRLAMSRAIIEESYDLLRRADNVLTRQRMPQRATLAHVGSDGQEADGMIEVCPASASVPPGSDRAAARSADGSSGLSPT